MSTQTFDNDPFFRSVQFSWLRNYPGCIRAVQNQGDTYSCWAFGATATMYTEYALRYGSANVVEASTQQLIDHVPLVFPPCHGFIFIPNQGLSSHITNAFEYVRMYGVIPENAYPFVGYCQTATNYQANYRSYMFQSYHTIHLHTFDAIAGYYLNEIKQQLERQPLAGELMATATFMNWNQDDIYGGPYSEGEWVQASRHVVLIVGYGGREGFDDYYLIQNTWGTGWGHKGYVKVRRHMINCVWYPNICWLQQFQQPQSPLQPQFSPPPPQVFAPQYP